MDKHACNCTAHGEDVERGRAENIVEEMMVRKFINLMKTTTHRSEKLNKLKHKKHKENDTMANDSQMSQHQWYKNVVRGERCITHTKQQWQGW